MYVAITLISFSCFLSSNVVDDGVFNVRTTLNEGAEEDINFKKLYYITSADILLDFRRSSLLNR